MKKEGFIPRGRFADTRMIYYFMKTLPVICKNLDFYVTNWKNSLDYI